MVEVGSFPKYFVTEQEHLTFDGPFNVVGNELKNAAFYSSISPLYWHLSTFTMSFSDFSFDVLKLFTAERGHLKGQKL